MQLTCSNITYRYEDSPTAALTPVTAVFPRGWTGIVGNNGCGKTTLLRLACGQLHPHSGSISPDLVGVYCAQETEHRPEMAADFIEDFSYEAGLVRKLLGIADDWVWRYDELSQGERKRLQVAVALWQHPQLLALDEPTNHVDAPTRARLIDALAGFDGIGLLVSHDREMLDALVQQCLFVTAASAVLRPGSYSESSEQAELEAVSTRRERRQAKSELARLNEAKLQRSAEADRADARKSKRNIAKGDRDAKARINLAIFTSQDGKAGKRSVQLDARLAQAQQRLDAAFVDKVYESDIWLNTQASKRRVLVELDEARLAFGSGELLSPHSGAETACLQIPRLLLGPTDHIAVTGANGSGKTTLVNAIMQSLHATDLTVLYLPQELELEERQELLRQLAELPQLQRGQVLSIVAQLNSDPARLLDGGTISPGEARKLMLALGIQMSPQIIVMDEPTNHLDLASTQALERLLAACPCALLLVSHDRRFLSEVTDIEWHIESLDSKPAGSLEQETAGGSLLSVM